MKNERKPLQIAVPLTAQERKQIDLICGPGRGLKRGEFARQAILEKLEREPAK